MNIYMYMCRYSYTSLLVKLAADRQYKISSGNQKFIAVFCKHIHTYLIFNSKSHNEMNI